MDNDHNDGSPLYVGFSAMSLGCGLRGGTVNAKVGCDQLTMHCVCLGMKNSPCRLGMKNSLCTVVDWA